MKTEYTAYILADHGDEGMDDIGFEFVADDIDAAIAACAELESEIKELIDQGHVKSGEFASFILKHEYNKFNTMTGRERLSVERWSYAK